MSREFVCDVLQRYYGKKLSGKYKYTQQLYESIAREVETNVQMVKMIIDINIH